MLLARALCSALDIRSLKLYLLILEIAQKNSLIIKKIPCFMTLIHKIFLILCNELISVQPYLLLITKRIIFVTAVPLSCYFIQISSAALSEAASSDEDLKSWI